VSIAVMMIVWGTLAVRERERSPADPAGRWTQALGAIGAVLALGLFMTDAVRALPGGRDRVLQVLPVSFNWPLFSIALLLMAAPVAHLVRRQTAVRAR
jgi:hypothetical protein